MKKIIMFLFIVFFVTGCGENVDYTLEISPNTIEEKAFLELNENDYAKAIYLNDVFNISDEHYNTEEESGSAIIKKIKTEELQATSKPEELFQKTIQNNELILNYNYKEDNYNESKLFNECFTSSYYDSNEEYYIIKGYDQFKCLHKEEIKIVIKTDYKIIESNADKINRNEYIWYFNEDNYLEHELYIQVSKQQKRTLSGNWKMYVLIIGLVIYVTYKILVKENIFIFKKNNEI